MPELTAEEKAAEKLAQEEKEKSNGDMSKLTSIVTGLAEQVKSLTANQAAGNNRLETLLSEAFNPNEEEDEVAAAAAAAKGEVDFEKMSPQQVVDHITGSVTESITGGIGKQLKDIQTEVFVSRVLGEMDFCDDKYSDFWTIKDEVRKEATSNSNLSVEDAYLMVKQKKGELPEVRENFGRRGFTKKQKNETPEEKKVREDKEAATKLAKGEKKLNIFTGEKPAVGSSTTAKDGKFSSKQAAEQAYSDMTNE